jgi:DNA uptake protein ComE-like DNA-binding protein
MKGAFIAGFGVGAALGMIVAPKRGKELRADWRERLRGSRHGQRPVESRPEHDLDASETTRLNTATREQLLSVYGIGPVLADRIIAGRPYSSTRDVVDRGIITESIFANLQQELLHG